MKLFITSLLVFLFTFLGTSQTVSSFEDADIPIDSFWNGSDLKGVFVDGGNIFVNKFDTTYNLWSGGWAISSMRDDSTAGYANIYSAIPAKASRGNNYAIGQQNAVINADLYDEVLYQGLWITNTTYAYLSMKNGDSFAKKFGGETGEDPDFFKLRIYGIKLGKVDSTNYVDFYLADFTDVDSTQDYIVDSWEYVDLSSLGYVSGLSFELSSSDVGQWGMNTPAFFAADKIKISYKPEEEASVATSFESHNMDLDSSWYSIERGYFTSAPYDFESKYDTTYNFWSGGFALSTMRNDSTAGFSNLYGAIAGGAYDGITYAVGQNNAKFYSRMADTKPIIESIKICNTTYAYLSMKNGDSFAKKFGGDTGDDPDFFKLRIYGIYSISGIVDSSKYLDFYLADYRFDDNSKDYIVTDWTEIDIAEALGKPTGLAFELSSSDVGGFGMNTPAFFAMDKISYDLTSGIIDYNEGVKFDIYPNPAIDVVNVNTSIGNGKYEIFNMYGSLVLNGQLSKGDVIDVRGLNAGSYIIVVSDGINRSARKIVVASKK